MYSSHTYFKNNVVFKGVISEGTNLSINSETTPSKVEKLKFKVLDFRPIKLQFDIFNNMSKKYLIVTKEANHIQSFKEMKESPDYRTSRAVYANYGFHEKSIDMSERYDKLVNKKIEEGYSEKEAEKIVARNETSWYMIREIHQEPIFCTKMYNVKYILDFEKTFKMSNKTLNKLIDYLDRQKIIFPKASDIKAIRLEPHKDNPLMFDIYLQTWSFLPEEGYKITNEQFVQEACYKEALKIKRKGNYC